MAGTVVVKSSEPRPDGRDSGCDPSWRRAENIPALGYGR